MKLVLIALMLFNQGGVCSQQHPPSIRVSVVSQKKFRNRGHHPENNRRVIFRVVNESNKPVVIYGFKYDGEFDPTGYMMVLNKDKNEWEYPDPANASAKWSDVSSMMKDKRILKPGQSINTNAEMSEFEVGSQFRRTVYVSYHENDEPCEVRSKRFVLK